jgi:transcriptional regulator with XRE-family HTH domain
MSIASEFAERAKRIRLVRGLDQYQLADMCGVSQNTISNAESGSSAPGFMTLVLMARALDVSLDYLCLGMVGQSFKHTQKELA